MKTDKNIAYRILDACIALLFFALLWRLYAPVTGMQVIQIHDIETQSITVEDIIRELHAHANDLPEEKRRLLLEQLKRTEKERDSLLEMMEQANQIDQELSQMAIQIWASLTPEQRLSVRNERNAISVDKIERLYWESTKSALSEEE